MLRSEKVDKVADIKQLFEDSGAFFITDYQGLNVADMTDLRSQLRKGNVRYLISKNTLFSLAAKDAGKQGFESHFVGPTAIAFTSEDASVAAKILHESFKTRKLPRIKAFVVDAQVHGPEQMQALADLPSREVLLSGVVAAVEAPFTELIGTIDGFFRELVGSIDALADKKQAEG
ncbi:MAG: 50S ribosomal protein L10 [candidate division Zixibacteria bacterium]|nr:50S ribosomal protein L10 [candidate division Zixibacteria bacterium]